jgi:NADH:ubiquinone oxidoreductase subunit C
LKLVESNTQMALEQLKEDIQKYCGEGAEEKLKKEKEARRNESMEDDTNPFTALIKLFTFDFSSDKKEEKKKISDVKDIKSDNFVEKDVRIATINSANKLLYAIYDIYKKAHAMASSPESFDNSVEKKNDKPTSFMEFVETRKD